jgi:hypothetical protein
VVAIVAWSRPTHTVADPAAASLDGQADARADGSATPAPGTPAPGTGDATLDGATLFRVKGCSVCHDGPDTLSTYGFQSVPPLVEARTWAGTRRPGVTAAAYLRESVLDPSAFRSPLWRAPDGPLEAMPVLALTGDEVDAIAAYLLDH